MPFPTFKKADEVPEAFRSEYEEKNGEWVPKVVPADDGAELKETLKKLRKELDEAGDARKALERKLAAAEHGGSDKDKDKVAAALKKFDEDAAALKADYDKKLTERDTELRKLKLDDQVKAAFLKAGGRPERADKALNDTIARFDLADGRIVVKNAKGEATTQTVDDYFAKTYREEMKEFYTGTKGTGGNAPGGAGPNTATAQKWDGDAVLKDPLGALQAANAEAAGAK